MIRHPASQRGWTLTSLMVGMVVSLLVIIAMLALYRVGARLTFDPVSGMQPVAAQDRQATTGFLTAQNLLQSAGFGVSGASKTSDFVIVNTASGVSTAQTIPSSGSVTGTAIYWDSNTNPTGTANWVCQGLISQSSQASSTLPVTWSLSLVQASSNCNPVASKWNSTTWSSTTVLASGLPAAVTFTASATAGVCWPFGAEVNTAALTQTAASAVTSLASSQSASAGLSVQMNWSTNSGGNSWSSCLSNFTQ
ncbi:hypothetical protein [Silvimonas amylolytica]|uniref:Tfp pilus assembly protein PilX n=1 Tax=Silvimonas amylolytica TaxID=449663 RepID=A0ABQ2PLJ4_9NEIS|nr:hypothetical protein [Silvimonas amylolytica]GGP26342.1 hypothetical protein GCM10010971_21610 [Silvimonas amylolytica]